MGFFDLFRAFGRSRLNALERQVLAAISAELPAAAKDIFNKQIGLVNLIQRHADGKEVNLYVMRRGKPFFEDWLRFPLKVEEMQLASVEMFEGDGKTVFRAEVWLVRGRVFSIVFNKLPKKAIEGDASVKKVKILRDPMIPVSERSVSQTERREEVPATIFSKLPDEYLRLVGEGKGVSINDWAVSGTQYIRKVVQGDANYYLLAEKEGYGLVGVKEDEFSGQLYYLDYVEERGEKITVALRKFLEEFDGGKVIGRF